METSNSNPFFKSLFIILAILIISINLTLISAEPPELPVLIHGKITSQKFPVSGIEVTASWIQDNNAFTAKTNAISLENQPTTAHYKFKEGTINADPGTTIKITAKTKTVNIIASPGVLIQAPEIDLDSSIIYQSEISKENTKIGIFQSIINKLLSMFKTKK